MNRPEFFASYAERIFFFFLSDLCGHAYKGRSVAEGWRLAMDSRLVGTMTEEERAEFDNIVKTHHANGKAINVEFTTHSAVMEAVVTFDRMDTYPYIWGCQKVEEYQFGFLHQ